ncbi:ubiquinol-cytochrome-c reductase complex assembly factor 1 [Chelonus insularis]|uniref:ubiquinol-cytochrome-c reductase complex assembly factor 1 n=1 Tax=Chelonus insularis TaxID=460826 RepID=UPI001589B73D|nr:ubiquinol-cytochrome-c reductase complex assembly factor 1 [Chelonus insularis]
MHQIKIIPFMRLSNIIVQKNWSLNNKFSNVVNPRELLAPSFTLSSIQKRAAHARPKSAIMTRFKAVIADRYYSVKDKIYYHAVRKYLYRAKGSLLYSSCFDNFNYIRFMTEYNMPDTFYSWFLVTELHVWMIMVRLMAAGTDGFHIRSTFVAALWQDTDQRKKQLGGVRESKVQHHIEELGNQFKAAIAGYDEGLMGNDAVLAGAVWRRILQMQCDDPEIVEKLVKYIRMTLHEFDKMPHETFILASKIQWLDYMKPVQQ